MLLGMVLHWRFNRGEPQLGVAWRVTGLDRGLWFVLPRGASCRHKQASGLNQDALDFLTPLAYRDLAGFRAYLHKFAEAKRSPDVFLVLVEELGARVFSLTASEQSNLNAYFDAINQYLEKLLMDGRQQKRLESLLHIFDPKQRASWQKGSATARSGVVQMGAIPLDEKRNIPHSFVWQGVGSLPLRPLVVMPATVTGRDWDIE